MKKKKIGYFHTYALLPKHGRPVYNQIIYHCKPFKLYWACCELINECHPVHEQFHVSMDASLKYLNLNRFTSRPTEPRT